MGKSLNYIHFFVQEEGRKIEILSEAHTLEIFSIETFEAQRYFMN